MDRLERKQLTQNPPRLSEISWLGWWTPDREFHGSCGLRIGRNLLGTAPLRLAVEHVQACPSCGESLIKHRKLRLEVEKMSEAHAVAILARQLGVELEA